MKVFVTGTDTNIGKTMISSWICLHSRWPYFKPVQTGLEKDSDTVHRIAGVPVLPETYAYPEAVSPHEAALKQGSTICMTQFPSFPMDHLVIEGAGGVFTPLSDSLLMIDLIRYFQCPVVVVSSTRLGTINHTLLTLKALSDEKIPVLGVVMNGTENDHTIQAIEYYGKNSILATFPEFQEITPKVLQYHSAPLLKAALNFL